MKGWQWSVLVAAMLSVLGCGGQTGKSDLDQYMKEMRARPTGKIEPLPEFKPYEAFAYRAAGMRSPFELPVVLKANLQQLNKNVKPDLNRDKDYLEQFDIESISLVGSISNEDGLWGLVRSSEGVHRVKVGDYMGRNHGRIDYIDERELRVLEIVPAGEDFWIERPRSLVLGGQ
ncbi:pilus assembly protein PilP [Endozoicomonas montiporae]|uniref:Pilus assembly protein PilP n=2 Tax=Endozoicomonas montiporae TaxID=1027273 RepID=A0A081N4B1_9GAMM|nr:pilus assembly protein PilP [Endozoicomonas montiporae]AMO57875.1 type 4 fimbrial biogenesis protein PilP [Endozoicomonas montiporae CL-33]KEQ13284.1 pilus assembly protein PilP [Endozoicomonas montiporae]